jgi:hypothetical protein
VDISTVGVTSFAGPEGQFDVEVFDSASDYVKLMKYAFPTGSPFLFCFRIKWQKGITFIAVSLSDASCSTNCIMQ